MWPKFEMGPERLLEIRPLLLVQQHAQWTGRESLIPDVERFSQWTRYIRATAYAIRFVSIMQKRDFAGSLSPEDLVQAEAAIMRDVQRSVRKCAEYSDLLHKAAPFLDEYGVLRMRGRAARCESVSFAAKYPIIVGGEHRAIDLLVQHFHRLNQHQNTTATINELRQKIVMPRMKTIVKRMVNDCRWCHVKRARPVLPQMSALPLCRMAVFMPPFTFTGMDYFGPYEVAVGRRREKRWALSSLVLRHAPSIWSCATRFPQNPAWRYWTVWWRGGGCQSKSTRTMLRVLLVLPRNMWRPAATVRSGSSSRRVVLRGVECGSD